LVTNVKNLYKSTEWLDIAQVVKPAFADETYKGYANVPGKLVKA
jgi:hypothetical protein